MQRHHVGIVRFNIGDVVNIGGIKFRVDGISRKNALDVLFIRRVHGKVLYTSVHCDGFVSQPQRSIVQ